MRSAAVLACGFLLAIAGCKEKEEPRYVRPAADCACAAKKDGTPSCQCNHCMGEKGSKCYCATGGCACGRKTTKCPCGHCLGEADDPTCACKK